jgi:hypothetical protein
MADSYSGVVPLFLLNRYVEPSLFSPLVSELAALSAVH